MVHTPKANELCPHGLDPNICGYCWNKAIANMIDENTNLKQTVATQQARIKALEKEQSAWRKFTDEANRTLEAADKKIATLQARIQAALEVYAGMEGFIPETAAEGYCLRIIEQMNEALQESDDERV